MVHARNTIYCYEFCNCDQPLNYPFAPFFLVAIISLYLAALFRSFQTVVTKNAQVVLTPMREVSGLQDLITNDFTLLSNWGSFITCWYPTQMYPGLLVCIVLGATAWRGLCLIVPSTYLNSLPVVTEVVHPGNRLMWRHILFRGPCLFLTCPAKKQCVPVYLGTDRSSFIMQDELFCLLPPQSICLSFLQVQ